MVSDLFFYERLLLGLLWLCIMLSWGWPYDRTAPGLTTPTLAKPPRKRSRDLQPFPGLTHKPHCTACEQAAQEPAALPSPLPPPPITSSRGRPRQVDTSQHFCPNPDCDYRGWGGWGNLSANGHPRGGPWRQLYCSQCEGYFLETHGTPLYGSASHPSCWYGRWARWRKAWALGVLSSLRQAQGRAAEADDCKREADQLLKHLNVSRQ